MDLAQILELNISLFFLIFARCAGMIMLAPVFGARGVPVSVKIGLTGSLCLIIYPLVLGSKPVIPQELLPYVGILIKEILVGLVIGFIIYAITGVLEGAGQLIDIQMGFTMGNTLDPVYGTQSPLMGNFQLVLATMLLLATNAHHYMIAGMVKSYAYVPINTGAVPANLSFYVDLVANIFILSLQIALPVFGAIVLSDIGVGLLSRTVPQLNIFSVVFGVKILFGLFLLLFTVPFLGDSVSQLFNTAMDWLLKLYLGWKV